ncbi:MAG: hypothetical protein WBK48_07555 [Dethiobacteria bacterium]|jgi:hypothetical protein|nr:hypothetical protein [Bacillota bacterium]HOP69447.1 hypothetical protein [Bacillota bacterium]HPT34347.1 hypothetical protein [Bacillota bacterium]
MKVLFAIPLKYPQDKQEYDRIDILLSLTLDSLARQTNQNFIAVVCGHIKPLRALEQHPRTIWLKAPFPAPTRPQDFRADMGRKRAHIASSLRALAPFYFMALDGDDLINESCVDYVLSKGRKRGVYFKKGYALDFRTGNMAPIPGLWGLDYHRVCGSSAIIYMKPEDLPAGFDDQSPCFYQKVRNHTRAVKNCARAGRRLIPFPQEGGVYVLNNGANTSYTVIKEKREDIGERIRKLAVTDSLEILAQFVDPELYLKAREHHCFAV